MQVASLSVPFSIFKGRVYGKAELSVYMPTREEMEERQRIVAQRPMLSYL